MPATPFLWADVETPRRNTHVFFRREFELARDPGAAELSLFAHTHYHLKVNGVTVGVGPARSYPEFPEYDTYDIGPFLREGPNVVAVHVAHMGYVTFHHQAVDGCFTGWGSVPGTDIDLSTGAGWTCLVSEGYDAWTERFSFAIGATDIYDSRKDPADWELPGCRTGDWRDPVVLREPPVGELRPRSIPPLTNDEYLPQLLLSSHAHGIGEDIVSFKLFEREPGHGNRASLTTAFAYTYIFSPRRQSLRAGVWWGEHFLNGRELVKGEERPDQFARNNVEMELEEGWNFFYVSYGMDMSTWTFHLAVPSGRGLVFSADKEPDGEVQFMTAGPLPKADVESILAAEAPRSHDAIVELTGLWTAAARCDLPASPQRGLAWAVLREDQKRPPRP